MFDHSGRALFGALAATAVMVAHAPAAQAQTLAGAERAAVVRFAPPTGGTGYTGGTVPVAYAFLACFGELHVVYDVKLQAAQASDTYLLDGKTYQARPAALTLNSVRLAGTAYRGGETVGSFVDGAAGQSLSRGCMGGQTHQLGRLVDWLGPQPTAAQITNFLNSLRMEFGPAETLRSAGQEDVIRTELRRQQQAEAQRRADQSAADARKAEEARRAEDARRAATQRALASTPSPSAPSAPYAPPRPAAPTPPLTAAERADRAIAQDHALAAQRQAEQQRAYAAQQAAAVAEQQRQADAMAAAVPLALQAGAGLQNWADGVDERRHQRNYQAALAKWGDKCDLPNGMPAPKDGELVPGGSLQGVLSKTDCPDGMSHRYKAYALTIERPTAVQVRLKSSWRAQLGFKLRPVMDKQVLASVTDSSSLGLMQSTVADRAALKPGRYVITIFNTSAYEYDDFVLSVDTLDSQGRVVAAGGPPAASAVAPVPFAALGAVVGAPRTPAASPAAPAAPAAAPARSASSTLGAAALLAAPPAAPAAVPVAAELVAAVTRTVTQSPADLARIEGWKTQFAPGWVAAKTAEINALAFAVATVIDTRCNPLTNAAPVATLLSYRPGADGRLPWGVARYEGETSRCRPQSAGVIQYADGSRWTGEVAAHPAAPFLPVPAGLGEFRFADGRTRALQARLTADGWEPVAALVPPAPEAVEPAPKPAAKKAKKKR